MGLHLGWIPNEPGLRAREFDRPPPGEPTPDPKSVAKLEAAHHARVMWARLLIVVGLFALLLFGAIAEIGHAHARWAWAVAGGLALCCWLPVVLLGLNRRRAAARLQTETAKQADAHATELAVYEQGKTEWAQAEAERIATEPRWLQVAAHEDTSRLDVFGGTGSSRENMVTGLGWELLEQHAVIVLDLSQDRVSGGLLTAAARAGLGWQDYQLPRDLAGTPLLAGLSGEQIASLIVEVVHADDASATAAGRATDLMILKKITSVLGADVSMRRLHAALTALLGGAPVSGAAADGGTSAEGPPAEAPLTASEQAGLAALFGDGFRHQVAGNLVRLAAVIEPLTALGTEPGPRPPARLTCLSLADGPRDVAADLTAALVVQWVTRAVSAESGPVADEHFRPAVILAGADEQSTRHLARLTAVCERYDIPLVRAFSRLTEESARHLDSRHTAFMRLATRPEALRAAEHIGLERRFVAGRFAHSRSVSRSRTRTTSAAVTHTTGRTEGEASTHTTGTTRGQSYSEAEVPRQEIQPLKMNVETRYSQGGGSGGGRDSGGRAGGGRDAGGRSNGGRAERPGQSRPEQAGGKDGGARPGEPRPGNRGGFGGGGGGGGGGGVSGSTRVSVQGGGTKPGRPQMDIARTRTRFSAQHESDAQTKSWSATEETSHTSGTSDARTDGVSVADEIGYELVYDHKVQPETLMALPEDQMLAPHVTEAAAAAKAPAVPGSAGAGGAVPAGSGAIGSVTAGRTRTESKMVALIIDPAVVGTEAVAPVRPSEIPAFEPPAPAISAHVPDLDRVRPQLSSGEQP
jgi:uncharacterized membrane protein YgcG